MSYASDAKHSTRPMPMQVRITSFLAALMGGGGNRLGGSGGRARRRHCGQTIDWVGVCDCKSTRHLTQYTCVHPFAGKKAGSMIGRRQIAHSPSTDVRSISATSGLLGAGCWIGEPGGRIRRSSYAGGPSSTSSATSTCMAALGDGCWIGEPGGVSSTVHSAV